jgi:hypothetical protein
MSYLSLLAHSGVQYILCCDFALFVVVICTLCCQFILNVHFVIATSVFSNVCIVLKKETTVDGRVQILLKL